MENLDFKVLSYNILAPCYKMEVCGEFECNLEEELYLSRNKKIVEKLTEEKADVICLQEFWSSNERLRSLYVDALRAEGYTCREVQRTSHWRTRKDGLATFVREERIVLQDTRNIFFHDAGDRVAQLLLLAIQGPTVAPQQFLLVNTHLLFPHNTFSSRIRLREMTKILGFVESYRQRELCVDVCGRSDVRVPVIIMGDMNGDVNGRVYNYVRSQNFKSALEECWGSSDEETEKEKWEKWVSHRNHRGQIGGVDHVFFLNPSAQSADRLPPIPDWTNLVFREVLERIRERQNTSDKWDVAAARVSASASASGNGNGHGHGHGQGPVWARSIDMDNEGTLKRAFADFDEDKSQFVTREEFEAALLELGFGSEDEPALTPEEIDLLVATADKDGNGTIDFKEFCERFERAIVSDFTDQPLTNTVPFSRSTWLVDDLGNKSSGGGSGGSGVGLGAAGATGSAGAAGRVQLRGAATELSKLAVITKVLPDARPMGELSVKAASLWPRSLEQGSWPSPEDYSLSDHGMVIVTFSGSVQEGL